jgi:peptidoglycan/xylan/chitin deacetylase (PgdA/CDA1 family)
MWGDDHAQVLAMTLIRAKAELRALQSEAAAAGGAEAGGDEPRLRHAALQRAWMPFAVAQKAPYWDVVSMDPEDNPEEFRAHIRRVAVV